MSKKLECPPYLFSRNQLTTLPPEIGSLTALQTLRLDENQLTALLPEIGSLTLTALFLHANPALSLPPEVLGPEWNACKPFVRDGPNPATPTEILRFYFRRQQEKAEAAARGTTADECALNEVKILIVGETGVGKTDLAHWLIDNAPHPNPQSTMGIKIATWKIPEAHGGPIRANVWDFGGQEIMQATHQFFLTERSLYLLVLDSRENEEQGKVRYWLDKIRAFGGNSPVIVVLNKMDEGQEQPDATRLTIDYSGNIRDRFFRTACRSGKWAKAGDGIADLRQVIIDRAAGLENVRVGVPRSYLKAKELIEQAAAEYKKLDRGQFEKACDDAGVPADPVDRSTLLTFLKCLGTVYHYDRPGLPGNAARTFVLDPEWLSDGVYTILTDNELLQSGGRLDPRKLGELFARAAKGRTTAYCDRDYDFLLEMMEGDPFELCFRIPNSPDLRLVPERLAPKEPNHGIHPETSRNVEYHYKYLPGGLIPRFIVRMHEWLRDGDAWKNGVVLTINGQRVLVRGVKEQKRVYVAAEGRTAASRLALGIVRQNLESVHRAMKHVTVEERVPLPDDLGVSVTYKGLCDLECDSRKGPNYEFKPDKAKRDYTVRELLDEIEPPEARERKGGRYMEPPEPKPEPPPKPEIGKLVFMTVGAIAALGLVLALMYWIVKNAVGFTVVAIVLVLLSVLAFVFILVISGVIAKTAFERIVLRVLDRLSLLPLVLNFLPQDRRAQVEEEAKDQPGTPRRASGDRHGKPKGKAITRKSRL